MLARAHRYSRVWSPLAARTGRWVVDRTHPLASGLTGYWLGNASPTSSTLVASPLVNLVSGVQLPLNSAVQPMVITAAGPAVATSGGGGLIHAADIEALGATAAFTLAFCGTVDLSGGNAIIGARVGGTTRNSLLLQAGSGTGALRFRYNPNYGTSVNVDSPSDDFSYASDVEMVIGVSRSASDHELFVSGVSRAASSTSAGATISSRTRMIVGQTSGGNGRNARFVWFATWSRGLSADEAAWISAEPYAMLRPVT